MTVVGLTIFIVFRLIYVSPVWLLPAEERTAASKSMPTFNRHRKIKSIFQVKPHFEAIQQFQSC